jgi:predicted MPP superfamily phosphohydrolase
MPPSRLARIVGQVNALKPDVIVLAGDFVSDPGLGLWPYPEAASLAPLAKLRATYGVYAVIGNHDYQRGPQMIRKDLEAQGIVMLGRYARQVGPLVVGGINHSYIGPIRMATTVASMHRLDGGRILVSHYPDHFTRFPSNTGLMLAGHTHCGQVRLFGWAPVTNSAYGQKYVCGLARERGNTLIVTAGLGTSIIPFRLGAPPDIWLVEVRPQ